MRQVPPPNILIVVMSTELGTSMLLPLLAFIFFANDSPLFSLSPSAVQRSLLFGLCLSLYKFSSVIANTIITALSDHFGRKTAMTLSVFGLLVICFFSTLALCIHNPWLLISGFLLGGCLDTNKAIGPAMIGDISAPHQLLKNMGFMQAVIAVGACLGPIIGGQITHYQLGLPVAYTAPFILAMIVGLLALLIIHRCPETLSVPSPRIKLNAKKVILDYWQLLQEKNALWLFFLLILCQASWSCYYEFIPPALKNIFNFSPAKVGIFMGLIAFWLIIAAGSILRFLTTSFSLKILMNLSTLAIIFGTLLSIIACKIPELSSSHFLLWLSTLPTAMGDVIFFSVLVSLLSQNLPADQQGKVMGLTLIISMLVWSLMALLGGFLMTLSPSGALLIAPLGALILLLTLGLTPQGKFKYDFVS